MTQLTQEQLDTKISSFMTRKLQKFPDLKTGQPDRKRASYMHVPRRNAFSETVTFPYLTLNKAR